MRPKGMRPAFVNAMLHCGGAARQPSFSPTHDFGLDPPLSPVVIGCSSQVSSGDWEPAPRGGLGWPLCNKVSGAASVRVRSRGELVRFLWRRRRDSLALAAAAAAAAVAAPGDVDQALGKVRRGGGGSALVGVRAAAAAALVT
ncbi:hypothetical protein JRQ81_000419, partial [Phrynocephalus forsythii]